MSPKEIYTCPKCKGSFMYDPEITDMKSVPEDKRCPKCMREEEKEETKATVMNGYEQAVIFDSGLQEVLRQFPIWTNAEHWIKFTRTLKTSLDIIENKAKAILNEETDKIAKQKSDKPDNYDYPDTMKTVDGKMPQ